MSVLLHTFYLEFQLDACQLGARAQSTDYSDSHIWRTVDSMSKFALSRMRAHAHHVDFGRCRQRAQIFSTKHALP